jgi:hypothetical protein
MAAAIHDGVGDNEPRCQDPRLATTAVRCLGALGGRGHIVGSRRLSCGDGLCGPTLSSPTPYWGFGSGPPVHLNSSENTLYSIYSLCCGG